jgi:hypothetical protein
VNIGDGGVDDVEVGAGHGVSPVGWRLVMCAACRRIIANQGVV